MGAVLFLLLAILGHSPSDVLQPLAPIEWSWIPEDWELVALVTYIVLISVILAVAYALGLIADAASTWAWIRAGRTKRHPSGSGDSESRDDEECEGRHVLAVDRDLEDWHLIRSQAYLVPGGLKPWLRAQKQIWRSDQAAAEFADLQMRLQLSKATWFNLLLLWAVALAALLTTGDLAVMLGALCFSVLGFFGAWLVLTHPPELKKLKKHLTRNLDRRIDWCGYPVRWMGWLLLSAALIGFGIWALACPSGLCATAQPDVQAEGWSWQLGNSAAAFFGALSAVVFAYVRATTNSLYHRHVRDAYCADQLDNGKDSVVDLSS